MRLLRAEAVRDEALAVLEREGWRLRALGVTGDLRLVGGSSVPAALTRGDVDLHLRVTPARFDDVVARLHSVYRVVHPEIWAPTLATFTVDASLPTGIAVTPTGSEHDVRFTVTWQRLADDTLLLAEYNALKLGDDESYERRKSAFFDRVVADALREHGDPR